MAEPVGGRQPESAVDQSHVRKCLRKIADQTASGRVVLLGEEAQVIAGGEETLE